MALRGCRAMRKYFAAIDCDVFFQRAELGRWATIDALQIHRVVQPWSYSLDLGPDQNPIPDESGQLLTTAPFAPAWVAGDVKVTANDYGVGQPLGLLDVEEGCRQGHAPALRLCLGVPAGNVERFRRVSGTGFQPGPPTITRRWPSPANFPSRQPPTTRPPICARLRVFANLCDQHVRQDLGVVPRPAQPRFPRQQKKTASTWTAVDCSRRQILIRMWILVTTATGYRFLVSDNRVLRDGLRRPERDPE